MFTFDVDPAELFAERSGQFVRWGIPEDVVAHVRAKVDDMWGDTPSSWTPAWAEQAAAAESRGDPLAAALCWGAARFPCNATPARREAHRDQLERYGEAVERLGLPVERHVLDVPYGAGLTPVPVYLRGSGPAEAVLVVSGGVDTWKVELHRTALAASRLPGLAVAVLDMPGTGESEVPLAADADTILHGVIDRVVELTGARRTGFLGISFGGHWAAKLALTGHVGAAIDIGGPTGAGGPIDITALPNGMPGILGNALGLDAPPGRADAEAFGAAFSLRAQGLLGSGLAAPLLAVNGTADPYIPAADTTVFAGDPRATVWMVRDAGHCASEHLGSVMPAALAWAGHRLAPTESSAAAMERATTALDPLLAGGR